MAYNSMNRKKILIRPNLDEVSFVRPLLILLVILYHSMAIHTGNWDLPEGVTVITTYKVIGRVSYAFMLESFVFVSGYVWAYQRETRGKKEGFFALIQKKAIRLLVPTIIFGLLYIFLLENKTPTIIHLLEGPGHLWFLPMLFECFLISWLILYMNMSLRIIIPLLFFIGILIPAGLPLRLSLTLYYLPFFLLGYYLYNKYDNLYNRIRFGYIIALWIAFFFFYFGMVSFRSWLIANVEQSILLGWGKMGSMAVYATIGTFALFFTAIWLTKRIQLPKWYVKLGSYCMGVYIFQQFVLEIVYYDSVIPSVVPNWALPLYGFMLALVVSLALTFFIRSTNVGKSLI